VIREEVARRRQEYESAGLDPDEMADEPFSEFEQWFAGAIAVELYEPSAFVLSTASVDAAPSGRAVLMKDFSDEGLVFYTNMVSRKSRELEDNPKAAATFVWVPLHRQVRFEGDVVQVTKTVADAYFATRPRGAQLAAHASRQSQIVSDRTELEKRFETLDGHYEDEIPRPDDWGGWRLQPTIVEFWQGRPNRFHDRVRYRLLDGSWKKERLAP
jgi:pyridoxamine 5'-phosphate oxidase